jgi:hypothetical protein
VGLFLVVERLSTSQTLLPLSGLVPVRLLRTLVRRQFGAMWIAIPVCQSRPDRPWVLHRNRQ